GIDIDLAYAIFDAFTNFLYRDTVSFTDVAAMLANNVQPFLGHGRRTVHNQMRIGNARVDGADTVDGQNVAGGFAGKFIGAVAGADGNGQRINAGSGDKIGGLFRIGQQLFV